MNNEISIRLFRYIRCICFLVILCSISGRSCLLGFCLGRSTLNMAGCCLGKMSGNFRSACFLLEPRIQYLEAL